MNLLIPNNSGKPFLTLLPETAIQVIQRIC